MIIVMGGSTGAGKTTHGKILADRHGMTYISSGDIARGLMDQKTDELFKDGQLSPHEEAIRSAIYDKLAGANDSVLDGFPRLAEQYSQLKHWALVLNQALVLVWLRPSRSVLVHRWGMRHRDAYDTETAAKKRDELYNTATLPLLEQFSSEHLSLRVDIGETDEPIDSVQNLIQAWFKSLIEGEPTWTR